MFKCGHLLVWAGTKIIELRVNIEILKGEDENLVNGQKFNSHKWCVLEEDIVR